MAKENDDFAQSLKEFNEKCQKKATRQLRRVSMKALELIVKGTPVLTGCCRGNWTVSVGDLSRTYNDQKFDVGGGATIKAGAATISSAKLGRDVLIENSCPYVFALENGWSRQQPAGCMIASPLAKLKAAISSGAK